MEALPNPPLNPTPPPSFLNPTNTSKLPEAMYDAYECLWRTDILGAETILKTKQDEYNASGRVNVWLELAKTEVAQWKHCLEENEETKKEVVGQLSKTEKLVDWMYSQYNPGSIGSVMGNFFGDKAEATLKLVNFLDALITFAFWHLFSCLWNYQLDEKIKVAYHFQRCWSKLSEAQTISKKLQNLKINTAPPLDPGVQGMLDFVIGLFHFILSVLPPSLQTITTVAGFEADRTKAIIELERSVTSGCVWAPVGALIVMGLKQVFLDDRPGAGEVLDRLVQAYPHSIVIRYAAGYMARVNGRSGAALEYFQSILEFAPKNRKIEFGVDYLVGHMCFLRNEWDRVLVNFERFLERPIKEESDKAYRPYAAYILGFAYWTLQGDNPETTTKILSLYSHAKTWVRSDEPYDKYAKRKMSEFLEKKKFDPLDQVALASEALNEGLQFEPCEKLLLEHFLPLLENPKNFQKRDFFALYYYLMGCCQKGKKNYPEAEKMLKKAIEENDKILKETYIVPMGWLVLGELAMDLKKWEEALKCFDKTKKFKDYDWENLVAIRVYGNRQTVGLYWTGK